jgi:hypothetical protein
VLEPFESLTWRARQNDSHAEVEMFVGRKLVTLCAAIALIAPITVAMNEIGSQLASGAGAGVSVQTEGGATTFTVQSPANEGTPSDPQSPYVDSLTFSPSTTLTPAQSTAIQSYLETFAPSLSSSVTPDSTYGNGDVMNCNVPNSWSDANGTFTLQLNCAAGTLPWGFSMSSALKASIIGLCSEEGMAWWLNGVAQPNNAPHPNVGCGYLFHGTFNPTSESYATVRYGDIINFNIDYEGIEGPASLDFGGKVTLGRIGIG